MVLLCFVVVVCSLMESFSSVCCISEPLMLKCGDAEGSNFSASLWTHTPRHTHILWSLLDTSASQETMRGFLLTAIFLLPLVSYLWACMYVLCTCVGVCVGVQGHTGMCNQIHIYREWVGSHVSIMSFSASDLVYFLYVHFCRCVFDRQALEGWKSPYATSAHMLLVCQYQRCIKTTGCLLEQ